MVVWACHEVSTCEVMCLYDEIQRKWILHFFEIFVLTMWHKSSAPPQKNLPCIPVVLLPPKSYVDVPARRRKSDFLYTNFLPNFPPINIPFLKKKHPILTKLGAFYNNLPKIHPIYVIWAHSTLMKTPRSLYQISRISAPKGRHIIRIPCETPGHLCIL